MIGVHFQAVEPKELWDYAIMAKILIADDDFDLAGMLEDWLKREQYGVEHVSNGSDASDRLKFYNYDLVVLDWDMPKMSGLEVLQEFRARGGTTPVIMLTGKSRAVDKELGLDSGADDYLPKPFEPRELSARIRALLRRSTPSFQTSNVLNLLDLTLDLVSHTVMRDGEKLELLPKEFALLEFFMRHPNEIFSLEALLARIWIADSDSSPDAVRTCIQRLRKKIDVDGRASYINTKHRVGYIFEV